MKNEEALDLLRREFLIYTMNHHLQHIYAFSSTPENVAHLEENTATVLRYHRDMRRAGVRIHTFDIHCGWVGDEEFDPSDADRILTAYFRAVPDGYAVPRILLYETIGWQRKHPEQLFVYELGDGLTPEEIAGTVGTEYQVHIDARHPTDLIGPHSFASPLWRASAERILTQLLGFLEAQPYAERILGYHVGYGSCGETHQWGEADFSQVNREGFLRFGVGKYGSEKKAAEAWGMERVDADSVPIPRKAQTHPETASVDRFFHRGERNLLDYNEYLEELAYSLASGFAKITKELTGKIVGIFHGYLMYAGAERNGHTDTRRILEDPNVDFLAAPKTYYRVGPGQPGGSYSVPQSVNRKKLWVDEMDNRTHVSGEPEIWGTARDQAESSWVLWREFARNEMEGSGLWWMDLAGGWYDDPGLRQTVSEMSEVRRRLRSREKRDTADVLLVNDEMSAMYITPDIAFHHRALQDTQFEARLTGALTDLYRMDDLETLDLSGYRVVVFLNAFGMTRERFENLRFAPGTKFLWNFLPGGSPDACEALTGMRMRETGCHGTFPYLEILPREGLEVLETYADSVLPILRHPFFPNGEMEISGLPEEGIRTASLGDHTVCAVPAPGRALLRRLEEGAGCRFYGECGDIVYGDSRFTAVFRPDGLQFEFREIE